MFTENQLISKIHQVSDMPSFSALALEIFHFQYLNNVIYRNYCTEIGRKPENIKSWTDIPFLPIEFFKTHEVISGSKTHVQKVFSSSGTTGTQKSNHLITDLNFYKTNSEKIFKQLYGPLSDFVFLSLLPGYLERNDSSLVYMMENFNQLSKHDESGFYLHEWTDLKQQIEHLGSKKCKFILLGVSHALLELCKYEIQIPENCIVMETGGMKGHGKELVREDLHTQLMKKLNISNVHSEYGMTELLSQAYSKADGKFYSSPWMKIMIRDIYDPFSFMPEGKTGAINIVDLANIHSCAFIATSDIGRVNTDNSFEVLGRMDNSDVRGCNLLIA